jgi:hypothetical protein
MLEMLLAGVAVMAVAVPVLFIDDIWRFLRRRFWRKRGQIFRVKN